MCANIDANGSVLPVPEWKMKKSNLLAFDSNLHKIGVSLYSLAELYQGGVK